MWPARVSPEWTRTHPASHEVRTSLDGRHWCEGTTGPARFVRVTVRSADDKKRAGIDELRVTRAKRPVGPRDTVGPRDPVGGRDARSVHGGRGPCTQDQDSVHRRPTTSRPRRAHADQ
ncbi:hypothetical protein SVIO_044590 [Streptomyces violaceusniger]|uniref:F5/8 type C domain-containing protein n=1 Tax=Streptomyces violaceusniger TaxID=68280 RepID=A0A4D4L3U3_STRVO|nr:hypothetical protein SVIO_044590 [Streptomyces violaceusniger]